MQIIIGNVEFVGEGFFEAEGTLYTSMKNNYMTVPELEELVLNNEGITIIDNQERTFTFNGYNVLDAISYTYNTLLDDGTRDTLLNIQIKKG